jgi:hypothetical protein
MDKRLIISSERSNEAAITATENRIQAEFPASFRGFCLERDACILRDAEVQNHFPESIQSVVEVRRFISVDVIGDIDVEDWNADLIPFAEDSFGNLLVFKKPEMDAVYFWDHETDEVEIISESFEKFFNDIRQARHGDIPEPKNVKVWINPKFLQKQKDSGNA